ncbi:Hypothetical protein GbCGDNIH1_7237 [Granulibacter bethesdensis CGDNIH1]|uniref:Transposase n=1 Tax=Granulibacter bethesdensis (strain ATCC BAA-1260 / CGDNIH1) TaxID=391165 RepID=A0A286M379_GRABC|nr:Hypothetical protein GbCGDNIH1I4_7237 [Granulibacter bethesdensis]ASV62478.1 Hypothetical protein GbCGDNIH1_7237 [Granulibacter bethesdensis CGDNIH1]
MKPHSQYSCGAKRIVKTDNHNPVLVYLTHPETDKADLFSTYHKNKKGKPAFSCRFAKIFYKIVFTKAWFYFQPEREF